MGLCTYYERDMVSIQGRFMIVRSPLLDRSGCWTNERLEHYEAKFNVLNTLNLSPLKAHYRRYNLILLSWLTSLAHIPNSGPQPILNIWDDYT